MNVLVVCAHPDDEVLGPGGTLIGHKKRGDNVYSCILCEHVAAREKKPEHEKFIRQVKEAAEIVGIKDTLLFDFPNIKMNAVPTLDLVRSIEKAIIKFRPEVIYTHYWGDLNDDHKTVFHATMAAVRLPERMNVKKLPRDLIKEVICYEVPSSTEWSSESFQPNLFIDIKDTFDEKIKAIQKYDGIIRKHPHPRSLKNLKALANFRGTQSGLDLAEGFMIVRSIR